MKKKIMIQGTGSDVGKSVLAAALCRILKQDGLRVAPFKSQNMALNSYVTPDGREIGRAQGVQAEACGMAATVDMNPILIKPTGSMRSQIVVRGKPHMDMDASSYRDFTRKVWPILQESYHRLEQQADVIVIEGAGSPVEINLKDREIVNMRIARWLQSPVLLVGDIDRGGLFAQVVGTLELLEPEERDLIAGILINKFRGDPSLLHSGIRWLEERTGKPVLGLIPFLPDLDLEAEDSMSLDRRPVLKKNERDDRIEVAVIRHPHLSNFTDFDALEKEEDVALRYVGHPEALGSPDVVILPGSKNTVEDWLHWVRMGMAGAIQDRARQGGHIVGICGGYQMMGMELKDPLQVESRHGQVKGMELFPLHTTFLPEKRTVRVRGVLTNWGEEVWQSLRQEKVEGYEIHMGITEPISGGKSGGPLFRVAADGENPRGEGWISRDGRRWGTYLHGVFDNDGFRRAWLNQLRREKGWAPLQPSRSHAARREAAFDRLADHVRRHVDIPRLYQILDEKTSHTG
ncbi:cobyric acid synthase [Desmospora profundinema]|uniref:Cobyric acid synthase n=1 Tax=Desmospora profundinema TaxID=1571184 RepID=A0ABU1IHG5_9BACL|nr:cobyric acid synthase [Desmospora profundinema]MDR6224136.1 adenosylcobyric acid synthase [Desmospora profundinema]